MKLNALSVDSSPAALSKYGVISFEDVLSLEKECIKHNLDPSHSVHEIRKNLGFATIKTKPKQTDIVGRPLPVDPNYDDIVKRNQCFVLKVAEIYPNRVHTELISSSSGEIFILECRTRLNYLGDWKKMKKAHPDLNSKVRIALLSENGVVVKSDDFWVGATLVK